MQKFGLFWGGKLDGYRFIPKLTIYLYSREENIEIPAEQNTQISVEIHEVQVLHQMKIRRSDFFGSGRD